jgi:ABC-2 type transport system permease protein
VSAKLWAVVRREYVERVRTKAFLIGTILGPLIMSALMIVPILVARSGGKLLSVAVLDQTGTVGPAVEQALRDARSDDKPRFDVRAPGEGPAAEQEKALREQVLAGKLDGYVELAPDAVAKGEASYFGRNVSNRMDLRTMQRAVSDVLVASRLATAGLDAARVKELTREVDLRTVRLSASGDREDRGAAMLFAIILMFILYTSIIMWGQVVMTSVIEEKTSRVVEVVGSGIGPETLLAGKLLGVGGAGLTQFLIWAGSLFAVSLATAGPAAGAIPMPEITPLVLASFVLFFLLGFLFYAALYAAIGAAVNTVQEAQNFAFPVLMPLIVAMVCFTTVIESPDGPLSVTLSMIPGISQLIMFLRIVVLTPPAWQIALSIALLVLGLLAAVWMSARIYRVGILMYGKKPTFPELLKWVRHA